MIRALQQAWCSFWFRPAGPRGLLAARALLGVNALWIVLSRSDLADLAGWPPELWAGVTAALRVRYLIPPGGAWLERAAYGVLVVSLVAAVVGVVPRLASFVAAALLYHFAPFEQILITPTGPYQGGLTLPTLGLFIVAFSPTPRGASEPSPDYRWPLQLLRLLLAFRYLFAGIAKLTLTGLHWPSAENVEATALLLMTYEARPPWAHWLVDQPMNASLAGIGLLAFELAFVGAVFSPAAARIMTPLAVGLHLFFFETLGVFPLNAPLLLFFVDWDAQAWRRPRAP